MIETTPPETLELLKKQILDQAYNNTVDRFNDTERMIRETAHSYVEKHTSITPHLRKDKLARVLAIAGIIISGVSIGIGVGDRRPPTDLTPQIVKLQSQLQQDTSRIATLADQLNQVKKSPTLQQEAYLSCVRFNSKFYPADISQNCDSLKPNG